MPRRNSRTGWDIERINDNALNKRLTALEDRLSTAGSITVTIPEPASPFMVAYEREKKGVRVTLNYFIPNNTYKLRTVLVKAGDFDTAEEFAASKIFDETEEMTDEHRAAGTFEQKYKDLLEYSTQYYCVRLVSFDDNGARHRNPETDPLHTDTFLADFTTPERFGSPSAPHADLIVFNRLDEHTPEFDAETGLKQFCPTDDDGNAQTYRAALVDRVKSVLLRTITGDATPERLSYEKLLDDTELDQVDPASTPPNRGFCIIVAEPLRPGAQYTWAENTIHTVDGKVTTTGSVAFRAAQLAIDLAGLTGVSLTFTNTEPYDDKIVAVDLNFTQPATVVALRNFTLKRKKSTDPSYPAVNVIDRGHTVQSDAYHVAGAHVIRLHEMKVKPSTTYNVQVILRGRGSSTLTINGTFTTNADSSVAVDTSLATLSAPTIVPSDAKIKVKTIKPSSNINVFVKNEIAARVKNGGGTVLGYLVDGQPPTNSATEVYNDVGADWNHTFNWRKSQILTLHPTAATIEFYNKVTNGFGVSSPSAATPLTISTWEGEVTPGALAFPSAPSGGNNTVDGDPEKNMARVALTLATSSGTFEANNISNIRIILIRRNAANSADVGSPFSETKNLRTADLSTSSVVHEFFLRIGQKFRITEVIAIGRNADKKTSTTGTADFTAGSLLAVASGDAKVVAAPVFGAITRTDTDDNKSDDVPITITQDGLDIVWYKSLLIEKNVNANGWRVWNEFGLKKHDALHASVTGVYTRTFQIPRRAGKSVQYRATATAVDGKNSATTTSGSQTATTGDVLTDPAAPTGLGTPFLGWDAKGGLSIEVAPPTTNINTLKNHYIVLKDSGSATYFNFQTQAAAANEAAARYNIGRATILPKPVKKSKLTAVFGAGASLVCYYYAENAAGTSSASGNSSSLSLTTANEVINSRDAVAVIDVGVSLVSPANLIRNGDAVKDNGTPTELNKWRRWNGSTFPIGTDGSPGGGNSQITTGSTQIRWDDVNHAIRFIAASTQILIAPLKKRLLPGEEYAFTLLVRSSVAGSWTTNCKLHYYNGERSSLIDNIDSSFNMAVTFSDTAYRLIGGVGKMKESPTLESSGGAGDYSEHWLGIEFTTRTNDIYVDKAMKIRGKQPMLFAPRPDEQDDSDIVPVFLAVPDVVAISGTQGGFFGTSTGGTITPIGA